MMEQSAVRNADFSNETLYQFHCYVHQKKQVKMIPMKFHISRIKSYGQKEALFLIRIKLFNKVTLTSFSQNFIFMYNIDV